MHKLSLFYKNLHISSYCKPLIKKFSKSPCNDNSICGWPKSDYGPVDVHRSSFLNGMKVAAAKGMGSDIACCTIMFSMGSRCEVAEELGATHFLRTGSYLTGCSSSGFIRTRYVQQKGGYLTVSSDRQTISYSLRCPYYLFDELKSFLLDCGPRNFFLQHELEEIMPYIHEDLYRMSPEQRIMDLIQTASFTGGLANSIFCEEKRIYDMTTNVIDGFVNRYFLPTNCTIGSYGVPFDEMLKVAALIDTGKSGRPKSKLRPHPSKFRAGFETYELPPGSTSYVAMAVPSCGTCELNTFMAYTILAHACGAGTNLSPHTDHSPQSPISLLTCEDPYTEYKAFNLAYCDVGIFGILVKSRAETIRCAALKGAKFLKIVGCIDKNTLEIGRRRLKVGIYLNDNDCIKMTEGLALQLMHDVVLDSAKMYCTALDNVPIDSVRTAAESVAWNASNMAVAVVGDLSRTPHDGDLRRCAE